MGAEPFGDKCRPNHEQEGEGQHDNRGVGLNEVCQGCRSEQHDGNRHENCDHHDGHVFGHAHRRDDAVHREYEVEDQDLGDGGRKAQGHGSLVEHVGMRGGIDVVMDFLGCLPDEEQAAGDQDQVSPGQSLAEEIDDRLRQLDDDGDCPQQGDAHDQCDADADPTGPFAVGLRELVRQDRNENEVVDAQHDFHGDQCQQCGPGGRVCRQLHEVVEHEVLANRFLSAMYQGLRGVHSLERGPAPCSGDLAAVSHHCGNKYSPNITRLRCPLYPQ